MSVWTPDLNQVLALHDRALRDHGGAQGLRDDGILAACIGQLDSGYGEVQLYPDAIAKAARLAFTLSEGQPFVDGNKRTGVLAIVMILRHSGYFLASA